MMNFTVDHLRFSFMQAAEELLALEAIFGADFTSERDGFRLRMLPNPGSLDTCCVSCELVARYACC